ncbi:hypothetical protein DPMN_088558 [Dreissena polymorpha]|uniref:Uncharacterized protein n=1 Tax=Dreissena polymorpha TaxID=45954 RepID=A0A9D4KV95_DREPO|nr:hypothetical protein DPMN_088558 [Dreissena polymorpha]
MCLKRWKDTMSWSVNLCHSSRSWTTFEPRAANSSSTRRTPRRNTQSRRRSLTPTDSGPLFRLGQGRKLCN